MPTYTAIRASHTVTVVLLQYCTSSHLALLCRDNQIHDQPSLASLPHFEPHRIHPWMVRIEREDRITHSKAGHSVWGGGGKGRRKKVVHMYICRGLSGEEQGEEGIVKRRQLCGR